MIYQVLIFLSIICIVGLVLLRNSIKENRFFVLIPAGMVWGVCVYILLLNLISKLFPGPIGILISTFCLIILGIVTVISNIPKIPKLSGLLNLLLISFLILSVIYLARLKMTAILPVADSNMQWAYAASFARGNYPIKVPWQPDLNPNYHLGAYFLEGAILSFSKLPLITIHSILNTYFLIAGALFTMFIFWETKYFLRNIWLVLATCVLYISYGVVIFVLPGSDFLKNIPAFLTEFPLNIFAKGIAGASLVDLNF